MQREPDPVADAGAGAQALLGLSKLRDSVNHSANLPSLPNAREHHSRALRVPNGPPQPPPPPAQPLASTNRTPTVPMLAHARPPLLDTSGLLPPRTHAQPGNDASHALARTLDDATSPVTTSIPRLPPMSTAEGRTHVVGLHSQPPQGNKLPEARRPEIPRLQSISELAPARSPSLPRPAATELPKFTSLPSLHGLPHALPPFPQPHNDARQRGLWNTPPVVPGFHTTYHPLPTTSLPNYGSMATPPMLSMPVHHTQHSASELHQPYYPQPPPPQYSRASPTLPQLVPPQTNNSRMAPTTFASSTSFLPPPARLPGLVPPPTFPTQLPPQPTLQNDRLPPIINGATQALGIGGARNIPTCGDTATERTHADTSGNANGIVPADQHAALATPPKLATSHAPPSRGRIADLMNPADNVNENPTELLFNLATQSAAQSATQSEPLPVENARVESLKVSRTAPSEKVQMARDLFGSGDEVRSNVAGAMPESAEDDSRSAMKSGNVVNGRRHVIGQDSSLWKSSSTPKKSMKYSKPETATIERRDSTGSADDPKRYESDEAPRRRAEKDSSSETENGAEDNDVTRCPCGSTADTGTMIACDGCNTWQHRICMGFRRKSDVPNKYFCHLCRPEDVRLNCVAHPTFRERMAQKGPDHQYEPVLSSVKPIELRKKFSADLVAKRDEGRVTDIDSMFTHYAVLYRTHFTKDRQSVVEGLVVLTELPRLTVQSRLEAAIMKSKEAAEADRERSDRRKDGTANHHGKRSRPLSSTYELVPDSIEGKRVTPEKELTAAEKKELSREERKNRQVLSLFARLEERDKKKPRLGEPSGSPRTTALTSPKEIRGHVAKQPTVPSGSVNLSPSVAQDDSAEEKRNVISVDVMKGTLTSALPHGKRDRRNRDGRRDTGTSSSADVGKRTSLPRKRERQILGSGSRKRGKSEMKTALADLDPKLLYSVRLPGPSVIGSQVVPRNRRSVLDNMAFDDSDIGELSAKQSTKKERYRAAAEREEAARNRAKKHAIRKRLASRYAEDKRLKPERTVEKKTEKQEDAKKDYSCAEELHGEEKETHLLFAKNYAAKKRVLTRTGHVNGKKGVERVCFKKRLMRSGPTKVSVRKAQEAVKMKLDVTAKPVVKESAKSASNRAPEGKTPVSSSSSKNEKKASSQAVKRPPSLSLRSVQTPSPPCRPPPLRSSPLVLNAKFLAASPTPPLRSSPSPVPPLRSKAPSPAPPLRSAPPNIALPMRSSASSPTPPLRSSAPSPPAGKRAPPSRSAAPSPPAGRIVPPLRSFAPSPPAGRQAPPLRSSAPSPPAGRLAPPSRSCAPSPPPGNSRTPPPPLRSAAFPRVPFRSKPLAATDKKNSNAARGSESITANGHEKPNAVSTSQIFNSRLESLLKSQVAEVQTPSPRVPKPIPRLHHPHPRHPRLNPSPRVAGPGLGPAKSGAKPSGKARRSGDRQGRRNGLANGGTDTTPWGRYRQQNGWSAIYANPSAGSSQDGKNNGSQRRRPPYG